MPYLLLAILNRQIHQLGILGLLGCGQDEGRVGGGILRFVLFDSLLVSVDDRSEEVRTRLTFEVARIADNDLVHQLACVCWEIFVRVAGLNVRCRWL